MCIMVDTIELLFSDFRGVDVYITVGIPPLVHDHYLPVLPISSASQFEMPTTTSDAQIIEFLILCLENSEKAYNYQHPGINIERANI